MALAVKGLDLHHLPGPLLDLVRDTTSWLIGGQR
jgi:hypothetical protein